jgi:hypothetical protein
MRVRRACCCLLLAWRRHSRCGRCCRIGRAVCRRCRGQQLVPSLQAKQSSVMDVSNGKCGRLSKSPPKKGGDCRQLCCKLRPQLQCQLCMGNRNTANSLSAKHVASQTSQFSRCWGDTISMSCGPACLDNQNYCQLSVRILNPSWVCHYSVIGVGVM